MGWAGIGTDEGGWLGNLRLLFVLLGGAGEKKDPDGPGLFLNYSVFI